MESELEDIIMGSCDAILIEQPISYSLGIEIQKRAREYVGEGNSDGVLILLQHTPVITIGRAGGKENLLKPISFIERQGIEVIESNRGGNTLEQMFYFVKEAKKLGVDIINVSSGGVVAAQPLTFPGYQIELAHKIKENCDILTIAGGLVTTYELAEEIVESGRGDMVFLGRELLRNPYWPINSSHSKGIDFQWPKQYERSK